MPGFEGVTWLGIVAPAGTPREAVARLQSEIARALGSADLKERFASQGAEAASSTPAEFAALIRSDIPFGRRNRAPAATTYHARHPPSRSEPGWSQCVGH
jgi:tripartite-type tricarboxylate transporter receptor subunit TctC